MIDRLYLALVREIFERGATKPQRATTKEGRPLMMRSLFGYQFRVNLAEGFPLLTTKRVSFLGVAHELIWFLRGETNIRYLRENKVPIWDAWADSSGELGPIYGKQWRNWVTPEGTTVDQIAQLLRGIREVVSDPRSSWGRRLLLTSWNPGDMPPLSTPTGCHTLAQFNITDGRLSCQMVQRSADVFLGVPYNIASYALLTHILATVCNLQVGEYIHTFGDAHIYENHEEQLRLQLEREPRALPKLRIADSVRASTDLKDLRIDQFSVEGYDPHPAIKGDVAI